MQENTAREWLRVRVFHQRHPEVGSLNFVYQMARAGELLSIRLSSRILIASDALDLLAKGEMERVES
jgi:hypothetical protein